MRRIATIGSFLLVGCGGPTFYSSSHWVGRPIAVESVKVLSEHHSRTGYREVGFVPASGGSFDAAATSAKEAGAEHGCAALGVESQSLSSNTAGSAWGATKTTVRFACLVRDTRAAKPTTVDPTDSPSTCVPGCRSGYDCVGGSCLLACNPSCTDGEVCKGHGDGAECVAR